MLQLFALLLIVHSISAATVTFTENTANIANPERGFHKYLSSPVDPNQIENFRTQDSYTMAYYITYLKEYVYQDVPQSVIDAWEQDIIAIRTGGAKCVIRFAYTEDESVTPHDATLDQVLSHIAQFKPAVQRNIDVIYAVQVGFIGTWGEWYYSTNFVDNPDEPWVISPEQYAKRKQVTDAVLDMAYPRMVQLRTPMHKQAMYNPNAMSAGDSHDGSANSRIGFHDDCFLASDNDEGTYDDQSDRDYMAQDTLYTPMGGETCGTDGAHSECDSAQQELATYHWTHLNIDYNTDVLNSWTAGGCMDTIKKSLGYRLVLLNATLPSEVAAGSQACVTIYLKNDGYAAPLYDRDANFVLRGSQDTYWFPLSISVWQWYGKQTASFNQCFNIPQSAAAGSYTLLLSLADTNPSLANLPYYSIQFANTGTWEADTGLNIIGTITTTN